MSMVVITLNEEGGRIAAAIAARYPEAVERRSGRDGELASLFARAFAEERRIVCVMAAGIAVRMIAPLLRGKLEDPAVVVVDDAARSAISLLSGHEGGANELAYEVAAATGARPIVTTGSEASRRFVLGIGCRRGIRPEAVAAAIGTFLEEEGLETSDIRLAASIRRKADEGGLIEALRRLGIAPLFLAEADVAAAAKAAGLEPSAASRHDLGVPSVAEPCALLASRGGRLRAPKRAYEGVTLALAEEDPWQAPLGAIAASEPAAEPQAPRRGSLDIVGLGPGSLELLAPGARRALLRADFVAGYGPYVEMIAPLVKGKELFTSSMREEAERARRAIDEALSGRRVALVASGDACVYGIGGIALELASEEELASLDVSIHPGITAANAAASLVGSPFENDYAVISLSDILTSRERIRSRLRAVAEAGFAVALYNPRSHSRKEFFRECIGILLESRAASTPAAIVSGAYRKEERSIVCALGELLGREEDIGMGSIVIVASPAARIKGGLIVEPRGANLVAQQARR
jgi:cobalt-precorrin 5A hydrolase / precorrin-3B C17-methyltransferase